MSESTSNKSEFSLEDLSPAQLVAIRNQLEQDILVFKGSFSQLKVAHQKFSSCIESIESLDKSNSLESKQSLIPVTNSLFLKGYVEDTSKVLVDIGTGYWMEKNHSQAIAYYKSKVDFVSEQLLKLNELLLEKTNSMNAISAYIQHVEENKQSK